MKVHHRMYTPAAELVISKNESHSIMEGKRMKAVRTDPDEDEDVLQCLCTEYGQVCCVLGFLHTKVNAAQLLTTSSIVEGDSVLL